ncbi:MAG: RND transporter, partial [Flammeovirgaceae bacterium]
MKLKRPLIITTGLVIALIITFSWFRSLQSSEATEILATAKKGDFRIDVETTGELEATNSVK